MEPEKLFCSILEREYDSTVALIDNALLLFPNSLRILKSNIKYFEKFVLDEIENELDLLEQQILSWFNLNKIDGFNKFGNGKFDFCAIAFGCEALRRIMFPQNGNDPSWVSSIPQSIRDSLRIGASNPQYQTFEKYVCKLSFRQLLNSFIDTLLDEIANTIQSMLNRLILNRLDEWIEDYFQAIASLGIYDLLDTLDAFANCGFGICNFIQTTINYREDLEEKMLVVKQGNGWAFKNNKYIDSIYNKETNIRNRIDRLQIKLNKFRTDRTSGSGIKPDASMK